MITVTGMYTSTQNFAGLVVNTTSKAPGALETDLSPFFLGPCTMYAGRIAANMENAWQYAKVYSRAITDAKGLPPHIDSMGLPTQAYWDWAQAGWANPKAVRYPMHRGAAPAFSLWMGPGGEILGLDYIEARKCIYGPLYAEAVLKTQGYRWLEQVNTSGRPILLRDYDGYDHDAKGMSLTDVLNNPKKKMGHAFVLKMLLTKSPALEQFMIGENTPLLQKFMESCK